MCGRFTLIDPDYIEKEFGVKMDLHPDVQYNVAPFMFMPVVVNDGIKKVDLKRWGLIPSWAKDETIAKHLINARSETVAEKPSYRHALRHNRCIIPASGFFEWKAEPEGKGKTPYYITVKDRKMFGFAGLYESWIDPKTKEEIRTFTIITCEPNALMERLHERMPVILDKENEDIWIDPEVKDVELLLSLLRPYPAEKMEAKIISKKVNIKGYNSPDILTPA